MFGLVRITEQDLRGAMREPRYWNAAHPERQAFNAWVGQGWRALNPADGAARSAVWVRAYMRDGHMVSALGGGRRRGTRWNDQVWRLRPLSRRLRTTETSIWRIGGPNLSHGSLVPLPAAAVAARCADVRRPCLAKDGWERMVEMRCRTCAMRAAGRARCDGTSTNGSEVEGRPDVRRICSGCGPLGKPMSPRTGTSCIGFRMVGLRLSDPAPRRAMKAGQRWTSVRLVEAKILGVAFRQINFAIEELGHVQQTRSGKILPAQ